LQTNLTDSIKHSRAGREADAILRSCVHCGFCLATCPTYQLQGDELDSPRGRIYLIKQMLEGSAVSEKTQLHLDRCLTCRACETTCPSGVQYGHLLDIGRGMVEQQVGRGAMAALQRLLLRKVLPQPALFAALLKAGQLLRPFLPHTLQLSVPEAAAKTPWPQGKQLRTMLLLDGCVQPALQPNINAAAARLLDKLGITLIRAKQAGCCGGISYHLNAQQDGLDFMRRNIDAWLPYLEQGAEAIVITASGCAVTVKEYAHLLQDDPHYADKAARISAASKDISEIVLHEQTQLENLIGNHKLSRTRLAFHSPCTLQHGQQISGVVENILLAAGFELTETPDKHLCCGSAGTYSILQKELSQQLGKNKTSALESDAPAVIASANIGCLMQLQKYTATPVRHWVELLDERLS
jgi:glycolate oxidase iron-sulfur subunit